ncbi:MAG: MFS transporter [Clostridiales bacterium]|nr:MFS transporter [Roseburia sp.]MDD7636812.1 MFS transporter [Clostridiales bacterium]MDY4113106.1 MFS transporter [Roseburia sp.]
MAKEKKLTQSEIDGVQYRRAKLWQIILYACNAFIGMSIYSLIGMASYTASIGFGISTAAVGVILTCTRVFDAVTDPMLAFIYDKVNTKFGKIRILLITGFVIEALALMAMYNWAAGKGLGMVAFIVIYVIYVIGYTLANMTAQTIPPLLTNDPKQRPTVGVWSTALNYLIPMTLSIILNVVLLPKFGGTYNLEFLGAACKVCLAIAFVGLILVCIAVSEYDKPENFAGLATKREPLKVKDMVEVLKNNRPLQCYIASAASDKIAQQTASQAVITTMLSGIIIGNMGLATILSVAGMLPSIIFAIVGAKYAGKHGSQRTIITWTKICIGVSAVMWLFFIVIDPSQIANMGIFTVLYVILTLCKNGSMMCVTTANTSFMSDIIDYELDRSGRYIPAVVTGTYSLLDKIISSVSALIATGAVALIGYTTTMPQPGEACTPQIFWLTMIITFGLPILGWICTLVAMRFCRLDKEEMIAVQKRIADKKAAAQAES